MLPSVAVTVTLATGVVPRSTGEGAREALVEVEICPNAEPAPARQIAESSAHRVSLFTTESGLRLGIPDLPKMSGRVECFAKYLDYEPISAAAL